MYCQELCATTATFSAAGSYTLRLTASDTQLSGSADVVVTVNPATGSQEPYFTSSPVLSAQVNAQYVYNVAAVDPTGYPLTYSLLLAPQNMAIQAGSGSITWVPSVAQLGSNDVIVMAQNALGASNVQSFAVQVSAAAPDTTPPSVQIGLNPPQTSIDPDTVVTISVRATDTTGLASLNLTVNGSQLQLQPNSQDPALFEAVFSNSKPGRYDAVATALDAAGNAAHATLTILVRDPSDTVAPTVAIAAPEMDVVLHAATSIIGTAADTNLVSYTLAVSRTNENNFVTISSGTASVTNAPLGLLDTSLLENGFYDIRLTATDVNGLSSLLTLTISVDTTLKVGQFGFSQQDLVVPTMGLPLSVIRTYKLAQYRHSGLRVFLDLRHSGHESSI